MSIQLVVEVTEVASIENALGNIADRCEIFPMGAGNFGVSIPTNVVGAIGEQEVTMRMTRLRHFNLWAGSWNEASSK